MDDKNIRKNMNAVCLSFILGNGKDNKVSDIFFFSFQLRLKYKKHSVNGFLSYKT